MPSLVELRRHCGQRVSLSLFDGATIIYAIRQQGKREYFYSSLIGRRMPTFCTAGGRALLAKLSREEVNEIIAASDLMPLTEGTIIEPEKICAKVEEARTLGYAAVYGECMIGEVALAAAVVDSAGQPVAAVHVAGSQSEWAEGEFERKFAPLVVEVAHSLSRQDGQAYRSRR